MGHAVVGLGAGFAGMGLALALGAPAWGAALAYAGAGHLGLGLSLAWGALRRRGPDAGRGGEPGGRTSGR